MSLNIGLGVKTIARIVSFFAIMWILGQSLLPAQAQEMACNFDTNTNAYMKFTSGRRLVTGESKETAQAAKEKAIKRMLSMVDTVKNTWDKNQCLGTPQIVCNDTDVFMDTVFSKHFYSIKLGFICLNDEGYIDSERPKSWRINNSSYPTWKYSFVRPTDAKFIKESMKKIFKGSQYGNREQEVLNVILQGCKMASWPSSFAPLLDVKVRKSSWPVVNYDVSIRGDCPPPAPNTTTSSDPEPKLAKDSPDPRINWLTQHDFSNKSYARAKAIAESRLAKKNLCRMRGGAVDFTYKQKRNELYWVTIKYRCHYD